LQTDIAITIDEWRRVIATQIREHGQMDLSGDHPRLVLLKQILDIMNEAGREKEVLTLIREFENDCYEGGTYRRSKNDSYQASFSFRGDTF
jgi:hypothetical protein